MENDKNGNEVIIALVIIIITLIGLVFVTRAMLTDLSVVLVKYAHWYVTSLPDLIRNVLFLDSQVESIMRLYNQSIYIRGEEQTFDRISAFFTLFQWPLLIWFTFLFLRYKRKTMPYTFTKQINGLDELMEIKRPLYNQVSLPYNYSKVHLKDGFLQRWGPFSLEEGPIRWCIKRGLVTYGGEKLGFPEFSDTGLRVNDDINDMARFAGKLDLNINEMAVHLKDQLGQPFTGTDSLCDEYIALATMFLLFSTGKAGKKEALAYKQMVAQACSIKNLTNKKKHDEWTFVFDRKKGLKKLNKLLENTNSKIIKASRTDYQFILSCYHFARTKNGDITPPDFQWLLYFKRELFLLLHCYNGSPKKTNNSPYIEVCAPLNSWALLYAAVEKDDENAMSNQFGAIDETYKWEALVTLQLLKVIDGSAFDKKGNVNVSLGKKIDAHIQKLIENFDPEKHSIIELIEKDKTFSKLSLGKKQMLILKEVLPKFSRTNFNHQLLVLTIAGFDTCRQSGDFALQELIKQLGWIKYVKPGLYLQYLSIYQLMRTSNLSGERVIESLIAGADATTELHVDKLEQLKRTYVKRDMESLTFYQHDFKNKELDDIYFFDDSYVSLSGGLLDLIQFVQTMETSEYSSEQLLSLADTDWYAIRQSVKSIIYYMSNIEKWLLPKYQIDQETLLGSPQIKINYEYSLKHD